MKPSFRISRRTVLRGAAAAVSLPLLDIMGARSLVASEATATNAGNPRVAWLYFPNGVSDGCWEPEETDARGNLRKLNRWMNPLEDLKEHLFIPRNVWTPEGNGHGAGTATWLTGFDYDERRIDAGGASVDQLAAAQVGNQTPLASLELSTRGEGFFSKSLVRNSISWSDAQRPMPREYEPRVIYDRMFRTSGSSLADKAVTDQVLEDARRLKRSASVNDQRKIDEYLESVRNVERRMAKAGDRVRQLESGKHLPISRERPAAGVPDDYEAYMKLMLDMITLAFWSETTRVCTFMLDHGQSNRYFNFIDGVRGTWHALSHWKDASGRTEDDDGKTSWSSTREKREMYNEVVRWHHRQLAYFLNNLRNIEEAGSNLLHQSMIVYGSSLADGHEHESDNLPMLVAGQGGGRIRSGKLVKYRRATSMSRLHLGLLKNMGVKIDRFGGSADPLDELVG